MHGEFRATQVTVFAPARLHLGFLDLHGGLGRRFGSIGLAIDDIATELVIAVGSEASDEGASATGPSADRALRYLASAAATLGMRAGTRVVVRRAIPEHVGLGSGTQLGLAIAAGLAQLSGRSLPARALADMVERGARSGIGIGAFELGGFVVDGGRRDGDAPAPIVARLAFPEDWRLLLVLDPAQRGLHGASEAAAFRHLPPFGEDLAGRLCRLLVMRLLPGVADSDFTAVSEAIGEIQERLGSYFAVLQGGRYASPRVGATLDWLREQGVVGVGQTSWGPTGFAVIDTAARAHLLADEISRRSGASASVAVHVAKARNRGAEITPEPGFLEGSTHGQAPHSAFPDTAAERQPVRRQHGL